MQMAKLPLTSRRSAPARTAPRTTLRTQLLLCTPILVLLSLLSLFCRLSLLSSLDLQTFFMYNHGHRYLLNSSDEVLGYYHYAEELRHELLVIVGQLN